MSFPQTPRARVPWWPCPWLPGLSPCDLGRAGVVAGLFGIWCHASENALSWLQGGRGSFPFPPNKVPPSPGLRPGTCNNCNDFLDEDTGETHHICMWQKTCERIASGIQEMRRRSGVCMLIVVSCVPVFRCILQASRLQSPRPQRNLCTIWAIFLGVATPPCGSQ